MHLRRASIRNIRSIAELTWDVATHVNGVDLAGWHVILGDNGSGKSSMLQAIALALTGPDESHALRPDWRSFVRQGCANGFIGLSLSRDAPTDGYISEPLAPTPTELHAELRLIRRPANDVDGKVAAEAVVELSSNEEPWKHVWGGAKGWFSASYGPFRRYAGCDKDAKRTPSFNPRFARHLTLFEEDAPLSIGHRWLQNLKFKALEAQQAGHADGGRSGQLLMRLFAFINSGLLPPGARLHEVTSTAVSFVDGEGCTVPLRDLGNGYRSVISMCLDLLYSLAQELGTHDLFDQAGNVGVPGVVLIDEVDAHLHPQLQHRIGRWFVERFPRMQFIVTTHSPLVCQPAEHSTIYRLPRPGTDDGGFVMKRSPDLVDGLRQQLDASPELRMI